MTTEVGSPRATGNPYVGPQSFRRGDAFYGRDRETADLLDLLIAERVVVLHSPSGAGKSSLIAAGLIRQLEVEGFEVLPVVRLGHEPPPGSTLTGPPRNRYALSTLLSLEEGLPPEYQHHTGQLDAMSVAEYLANWPDLDGKPGNEVLLFDQFEEVITADPNDFAAKEQFFTDIGVGLRDRNLWALFSIREDFLAELDPYSRLVPTRFANRYRLDLLGVDQALDAMILPAADRGADFKRPAAEKLVDDLRRIRVQRPGGVTEELGPTVEPVQLQVACRQVWNRLGMQASSIDVADVEALGDVDRALASYYGECVQAAAETGVSERALRDWFENELVTPQGIRGQVLYGPRHNGAFSEQAVRMLTDAHLVRAESRRGATWYELAHDRLIEPVKEDNARWREQHLSYFERLASWWDEQHRPDQALLSGAELAEAERWVAANSDTVSTREQEFVDASRRAADQAERDRRATRRTRRWLVVAIIGCVLAAGFGGWAWQAQRRASQLAGDFEITALASTARDQLDSDVDLSLLLARRAVALPGGSPTDPDTQNALQLAVDQSPVVRVLRGHGPAKDAVYSPDGRSIATYHENGSIVVWDAATGAQLYQLPTLDGGLINDKSLVFSPDGTQLAAVAADGRVAIWPARPDAGKPEWSKPLRDSSAWYVAFSPDGAQIAALGVTGLALVDETGQPVRGFATADSADLSGVEAEWTPDGKQLVIGDAMGVVSIWDSATGRHLRDIATHPSSILAIDMSPSGSLVASVSANTIMVTDIATGNTVYRQDRGGVADISFTPEENRLLVIDQYGTAAVIDTALPDPVRWATANGMSSVSIDADPGDAGRAVVATSTGEPAEWDVSAAHVQYEAAVEPLPDGGALTASFDGTVNIWAPDLTTKQLVASSDDQIQDLSVTPTGDLLAVARSSGTVEVWSPGGSSPMLSLSIGEEAGAWAVALSPDGRFVAAGATDGRIVVWEVSSGDQTATLKNHTDAVVSLDYGADATELVSASRDGTAAVWNVGRSKPVNVLRLDTRPTTVAWSNTPATRSATQGTQDSATREAPGSLIAVAGEDGSVQFWDPDTGQRLHESGRNEHSKAVNDIAFDRSGEHLVSASDDRSIIVWNATDGSVVERIRQGTAPWRVAFTAGGDRVVVADGTGAPHVVYLDGDELLQTAKDQTTRDLTDAECRLFLSAESGCAEIEQ